MGRARLRDLPRAPRHATRAAHRYLYDRRGQFAEGVRGRADDRAGSWPAGARAPDRRVVQRRAHPPGGRDLRGGHQGLVPAVRGLVALLLALAATVANAQPVIHMVVPFAAGGVQDIVARSFNAELGALLGRTVIVENRAGAGGT